MSDVNLIENLLQSSQNFFNERDGLFISTLAPTQDDEHLAVFLLKMLLLLDEQGLDSPLLVDVDPKSTTGQRAKPILLFKSCAARDVYEKWRDEITSTKFPTTLIEPFDADEILDTEETLTLAGRVNYAFPTESVDLDFVNTYYDLSVWLVKHKGLEKGSRIWYDTHRNCFFFEDPSMATNFKLKFGKSTPNKTKKSNKDASKVDEQTYRYLRDLWKQKSEDEWHHNWDSNNWAKRR